jgi:hypothetical protein
MTALADRGACAVLIGTGQHKAGSGLESLPAVMSSVYDMGQILTERSGLSPDRLRIVLDADTPAEVGTILAEEAEKAASVLLVNYVGHGLVGLNGELYLATRATDRRPAWLAHTSLAYSAVRNSLPESAASSLVVVLDSAAPNELALGPEGDTYTAFTGELLNLLRNGDPNGT